MISAVEINLLIYVCNGIFPGSPIRVEAGSQESTLWNSSMWSSFQIKMQSVLTALQFDLSPLYVVGEPLHIVVSQHCCGNPMDRIEVI